MMKRNVLRGCHSVAGNRGLSRGRRDMYWKWGERATRPGVGGK